jgi:hypothetical protein
MSRESAKNKERRGCNQEVGDLGSHPITKEANIPIP